MIVASRKMTDLSSGGMLNGLLYVVVLRAWKRTLFVRDLSVLQLRA